MDKIILIILLNTPGLLLPSWQKNPTKKPIKICQSAKNRVSCQYQKMDVKSYLERIINVSLNESKRGNFDVSLLLSIISNESAFNSNATGLRGEKGLCQIMPYGIASTYKVIKNGITIEKREGGVKLFVPEFNLQVCMDNLIRCRESCGNDYEKIAGCHNLGRCPTTKIQYIKNFNFKYKIFKKFL